MGKKVMRVRRGTPARLLMKTAPSKKSIQLSAVSPQLKLPYFLAES
jgi:hypothetical protein